MKALVIAVLLGLVAATMATECGILQRLKVKQQWAMAYGTGNDRIHFGQAIWKGIFHKEPKTKELFERVRGDNIHSPEFIGHVVRVLGGLDMCISLLDDDATLNAQLAHLNGQHKERGIPANYFDVFEAALMEAVPASLGRCFDQDAWKACFQVIAGGIKSA